MLNGMHVCFTGKLLKMPRHKAASAVSRHGGIVTNHVNKTTDILVVSDSIDRHTTKFLQAIEIAENGGKIQIMRESDFYQIIRKRG